MERQKGLVYAIIIVAGILLSWLSFYDSGSDQSSITSRALAIPTLTTSTIDFNTKKNAPSDAMIGNLSADIPGEWVREAPSSSMRLAQFRLPSPVNIDGDAELVVFNNIGGSVEQNLERWYSQFTQPDSSDSKAKAQLSKIAVNGLPITIVNLVGTYSVSTMTTGTLEKPNFGLLAAIVESPEGAYYFKTVGPEKTIDYWADGFDEFIHSIRYLK